MPLTTVASEPIWGEITGTVEDQTDLVAYVDSRVTGLLDLKGSTDCSANPNYPAASKGDAYVVNVAGKIGGASGVSVDVGDMYVASADNAGGTQAAVGAAWFVLEKNIDLSAYLTTAAAASTYLPLAGGTLSGLVQYSGTGHAGLRLNNLTTSERDAIAGPTAGMTLWNTTTSRLNVHNGSSWGNGFVKLDGDTMTGNLLFTDNTYDIGASGATRPRNIFVATGVSTPLIYNAAGVLVIGGGGNGVRGSGNALDIRDSTVAQEIRLANTYTSSTNYERGYLRWASNILSIGTEKGSGGGTARALQFETDGVSRLNISAVGTAVFSSEVRANSAQIGGTGFLVGASGSVTINATGASVTDLTITSDAGSGFSGLAINKTGAGNAITVSAGLTQLGGQLIQTPPSSVTLSTNGHFSIEMTSNTNGNLVYRGSDGTTRRFNFTVS